jgi:uracil-DNA glycosylase
MQPETTVFHTQLRMQAQGDLASVTKLDSYVATVIDDQIREKYLDRAIRELNQFTRDLYACQLCRRGNAMPVIGSGHPQADIMLIKHAPRLAEIEEGVAFYGQSGSALMKAFKRLEIDPLTVYGTLCVKCPVGDPPTSPLKCVQRLLEEIVIVSPKIIVVMGEGALPVVNQLDIPLARTLQATTGQIQSFTPSIAGLYVSDIDEALSDDAAKRSFWRGFRTLGDWNAARTER